MEGEILTVNEAAAQLKASPDFITELLNSGELPGRLVAGEWRTTGRALLSYVDGVPLYAACCPPGCCSTEGPVAGCCTPGQPGGCC